MKSAGRIMVGVALAATLSLVVTGCKEKKSASDDHPAGEHPKTEEPKSEHPEHPAK